MTYDNIKIFVSKTTKKIMTLWILLFISNICLFTFYIHLNSNTSFMTNQLFHLSEINNEATSLLYYNSQQNIADDIDYSKTQIPRWIETYSTTFEKILPQSIAELELLDKLGTEFFSKETLKNQKKYLTAFQELNNQVNLLSRLAQNYINESSLIIIQTIFIPFNIVFLLLILIISIIMSNKLKHNIINKNNFILEDIWNELQNTELNTSANSKNNATELTNNTTEFIHKNTQTIIENTKTLSIKTKDIKNNIIVFYEYLNHYQQQLLNNNPISGFIDSEINTELNEQIHVIQKLLSRLFTRSERASALAKATSNNGFQAGILALNTSIEAARLGDAGKNFIPISDKVKEFAEKSSQLGNAIVEELNDANLSIRKAYTIGKKLLESTTTHIPTENPPINKTTSPINFETLTSTLDQYNIIFQIIQQIHTASTNLENIPTIESTPNITHNVNNNLKETLIRSFERLYRFNYGINPPSLENDFFNKNI